MALELKMYTGPRGRSYYAVGSVEGKRINRTTDTTDKRRARLKALEFERAILEEKSDPYPKIGECLDLYLHRPGSVGMTSRKYVERFVSVFSSTSLTAVTSARVIMHCASPKKAPGTIRREITAIQAFLNYVREMHDLPVLRIKKPPSPPPLAKKFSGAERAQVIACCAEIAEWFLPHLTFYFYTGVRRSELCNLTWDDIVYANGVPVIALIKSKKGVNRRQITRRIPIHPVLVPMLEGLRSRSKHNRVFLSKTGKPIACPTLINKTTGKIFDACGLSHLTPHDMRRTFASDLLSADVSDHRIADLLGHIDLSMLKTYAVIEDDLRTKAIRQLPNILT